MSTHHPVSSKDVVESTEANIGTFRRKAVHIHWFSGFNKECWNALARMASDQDDVSSKSGKRKIELGLALPTRSDGNMANLHAERFTAGKESKIAWGLHVRSRPKAEPPARIKKVSDRFGGIQGIFDLLNEHVLTQSIIADYDVEMQLDKANGLSCKMLPQQVLEQGTLLSELAEESELEEVGYRLKNGVMGLQEFSIIYHHNNGGYKVDYSARASLRVDANLDSPVVADISGLLIARLFYQERK